MSDIRNTQHAIHSTLLDLIAQLRGGSAGPSSFRQSPVGTSPYTNNNIHSPASSGAATVTGMNIVDPLLPGAGGGGSIGNGPSPRTGSLSTGGHGSPATPHAVVSPRSALKRPASSSYQGPPPPQPQFVQGRSQQQSFQGLPSLSTVQGMQTRTQRSYSIIYSTVLTSNNIYRLVKER